MRLPIRCVIPRKGQRYSQPKLATSLHCRLTCVAPPNDDHELSRSTSTLQPVKVEDRAVTLRFQANHNGAGRGRRLSTFSRPTRLF